jgi:hypothetical protein
MVPVPSCVTHRWESTLLALVAVLAGCASEPPASTPAVPASPAVRPSSNVYFYPVRGQSAEQQDRDRYECYLWARKQTGYDPSRPRQDGGAPVQVVAMPPPGYDTVAGAATGAVIGAAVSQPWIPRKALPSAWLPVRVIGAAFRRQPAAGGRADSAEQDAERLV